MNKHTPAPWVIAHGRCIYGSGDLIKPFVASVEDDHNDSETAANARLIAASPVLLDACRCALADLEGILPEYDPEREHPAWETLAEVRAAITKATGEAA
jgi:hypothetical protein